MKMIKVITLGVLLLAIGACGNTTIETTRTTDKGGSVALKQGAFQKNTELFEFEYKGHLYISCEVRDGMALTHAGHCPCNKKENLP